MSETLVQTVNISGTVTLRGGLEVTLLNQPFRKVEKSLGDAAALFDCFWEVVTSYRGERRSLNGFVHGYLEEIREATADACRETREAIFV